MVTLVTTLLPLLHLDLSHSFFITDQLLSDL